MSGAEKVKARAFTAGWDSKSLGCGSKATFYNV